MQPGTATSSSGPTTSRSPCRCTPRCASHDACHRRGSGPSGPTCRSARTGSTRPTARRRRRPVDRRRERAALVAWVDGVDDSDRDHSSADGRDAGRPVRPATCCPRSIEYARPRGRRATSDGRVRRGQPRLRAPLPPLPGPGDLRRPHPHRRRRRRASPTSRSRSPPVRATSRSVIPTSSTACTTRCASRAPCTTRFPDLTFDCTVKVEHILRHDEVWAELAAARLPVRRLRVRGASTTTSSRRLDKGHTAADEAAARRASCAGTASRSGRRSAVHAVDDRSTTSRDLLEFVAEHDLVDNVDPVQYTIRLLRPAGLAAARPSPSLVAARRTVRRRSRHLPVGSRRSRSSTRSSSELAALVGASSSRRRQPSRDVYRRGPRASRARSAAPSSRRRAAAAPHRAVVLLRRAHRTPARLARPGVARSGRYLNLKSAVRLGDTVGEVEPASVRHCPP